MIRVNVCGKEFSFKNFKKENWLNFGEGFFEKGDCQVILSLPPGINLVNNNWQRFKEIEVSRNKVSFYSQGFFPNAQKLVFQKIGNWQGGRAYYLSFNYQTKGADIGVGIIEERKREVNGKSELYSKKLFSKLIKSNDRKDWKNFESVVVSSKNAVKAKIFLYVIGGSDLSRVNFKNLQIEKINRPSIVLHYSKSKTALSSSRPHISFIKINPTKYQVKIEKAKRAYDLVFLEGFHPGWRVYLTSNPGHSLSKFWSETRIAKNRHYLANGYANAWYITPEDVGGRENYELIVEFWPQKLFYWGSRLSFSSLGLCLAYLLICLIKQVKKIHFSLKKD